MSDHSRVPRLTQLCVALLKRNVSQLGDLSGLPDTKYAKDILQSAPIPALNHILDVNPVIWMALFVPFLLIFVLFC